MSVRNLGDWSPLDLDKDPVHADMDKLDEAQGRYQKIAKAIEDASNKLQKIVDTGSEGLAGKYVEELRSEAGDIKKSLDKAGVRYDDVVKQIGIYLPHLQTALDETKKELDDARDAKDEQTKAHNMPDGQEDSDGDLPPAEKEKDDDKNDAITKADNHLASAKKKLRDTMNALNTAGKTFGDAVNCNNYDDGLTDSLLDKFTEAMKWIAKIFTYVAMILGALAMIIPGVDLLVIGAFAATAIGLVANIELYTQGQGTLTDLILSAVGVGLGGAGLLLGNIAKGINLGKSLGKFGSGKFPKGGPATDPQGPPRIDFGPGWKGDKPLTIDWGADGKPVISGGAGSGKLDWMAGGGRGKFDWGENPGQGTPKFVPPENSPTPPPSFWQSPGGQYIINVGGSGGMDKDLNAILTANGLGKLAPGTGYVWGGVNTAWNAGIIGYSGYSVDGYTQTTNIWG